MSVSVCQHIRVRSPFWTQLQYNVVQEQKKKSQQDHTIESKLLSNNQVVGPKINNSDSDFSAK